MAASRSLTTPEIHSRVVLLENDPEAVLDELAQLLWTFRALSNKEN
jgi:hypothetical protein